MNVTPKLTDIIEKILGLRQLTTDTQMITKRSQTRLLAGLSDEDLATVCAELRKENSRKEKERMTMSSNKQASKPASITVPLRIAPGYKIRPRDLRRLNSKLIQVDTCLAWSGATSCGYGRISVNGQTVYTHVLSFWAANGGFLPEENQFTGLDISHLCGNSLCCRAEHLSLASTRVNLNERGTSIIQCRDFVVHQTGKALKAMSNPLPASSNPTFEHIHFSELIDSGGDGGAVWVSPVSVVDA